MLPGAVLAASGDSVGGRRLQHLETMPASDHLEAVHVSQSAFDASIYLHSLPPWKIF